ncbi:MAG TPA: DEAD/DEAH box helicase [Euzebyales bacterium]
MSTNLPGHLHGPTRDWFTSSFTAPTRAQIGGWDAIADGANVLVSAPTGSGKTLAAFLAGLDRLLFTAPPEGERTTRLLYVSPLKALAYDVDRNLRAPLVGITYAAERAGVTAHPVDVGMRTGDTPAAERRRLARTPPDILITTPESLYLLLTSRAREALGAVDTVIVDEVHAVAGTKRGAHLAVTLERLEHLRSVSGAARPLQRVGLSATQRPLDEVARFLGGGDGGARDWTPRPVRIVEAPADRELDVEIVVPVEDMGRLGELMDEPATGPAAGGTEVRRSIWPAVHPRILDLIRAHRSTIVFANSRRLAERLCSRLNDLAAEDDPDAPPLARAHHGSVAREQRLQIEEALKSGALRCVVATSSLELGIDMGSVDLVVQVESPKSVSSGLQRIGRAGHHVGGTSIGKVFPKYRGDLVECAVVVRRMLDGEIERTRYPRTPLDVLAQQVVAMSAMDPWQVDDLLACLRGAANFAELSRGQLDGVLDMLSGRYPSDEFAELRPRITWDRVADRIEGRRGAQRLAVTSGGTIPDRGLYGVFIAGGGEGPGAGERQRAGGRGYRRVGELDEEMVYETRPGETFTLGSTTWRIEDITRDQVLVSPAPGEQGKLPFWHGDGLGRPIEVGRAVGAFLRETTDAARSGGTGRLTIDYGLDDLAAQNLATYLGEQAEATGAVPSDRSIVVERFRDEIGDWRICLLSPFGGRVHAPWALAIEARLRERFGVPVQTMHADDGIVIRVPDGTEAEASVLDLLTIDPDDVEDLVVGELANATLFASRFRECAARALLLPRRRPDGRTPLWQQRQRAADLLAVASRYGQFPILLETYRECLRDVFDVPALADLLRDVAARRVRMVEVETPTASPFASSLLFNYIASYMYEGDAPLAERRAAALSLDRELLAELVGSDELRELIDTDALAELELELQRLAPDRRVRDADDVHDLLRTIGDLRTDELVARTTVGEDEVAAWLDELVQARRVYATQIAGERRWVAAEDAGRLRDGLGIPPPSGLPDAFLEPVRRPLIDLVARYARTHGPFYAGDVAARLGLPTDAVALALAELERDERVTLGEFRPGGVRREWCDAEVLRRVRRRSLAALRREVEPVEPDALARFLPGWQGVRASVSEPAGGDRYAAGRLRGVDRTLEVVEQLQGAPVPASVLEVDVLPLRVADYRGAWLDELLATGDVVWVGRGPLGSDDGRVALYLRDQAPLLAPMPPDELEPPLDGPVHAALLAHLSERGASFWSQLYVAAWGEGERQRAGGRGSDSGERQRAGGRGSDSGERQRAGGRGSDSGSGQDEVVEALWDLVWAGLVTNDSLQALRALRSGAPRRGTSRRRRRPGRVASRSGPPRAAGRWSLTAELLGDDVRPTARATALAAQLLDRYGVLTRDAVRAEDVVGGFSAVYGVLRAMEESGRTRRGYFVEGLGGAQFAVPGAVDRLRAVRTAEVAGEDAAARVLAATDPANPFGAALEWPTPAHDGRHLPKRAAGALVAIVAGELVAYVERGGRSLLTFTDDPDRLATAAEALADTVDEGRVDRLQLQRVDGAAPTDQPVLEHLRAVGFVDHPRGLIRRRGGGGRAAGRLVG